MFTGIGGFDLGFERAEMQCAWQVEIDRPCLSVLERHWPEVRRYTDVCEVGKHNLEPVDLICGGFPCQDLSVAGRRAGLAGERSGLWFEYHRILEEVRPEWVVIENVPGLLSSHGGQDFAVLLRGLVELGYGVSWRVLDSQYFGVPQRRRRVFIVGSLGSGRSAEVLFERESSLGDTAPSREAGQGTSSDTAPSINVSSTRCDPDRGAMITGAVSSKWAKGSGGPAGDEAYNLVTDALQARDYKGVGNQYVNENKLVAYNISAFNSNSMLSDNPLSGIQEIDTTRTLDNNGSNPACNQGGSMIAFTQEQEPKWDDEKFGTLGTYNGRKAGVASFAMGVRRLTPTECERLQSFPDGWTAGQSDSARYRQLGNAVTVNVIAWLGRRILEASG